MRALTRAVKGALLLAAAWSALGALAPATAQFGPPPAPDTRSARERAPIDLTGQWVAVVNEDWRWRMVTPPVGDAASLPINVAARDAAAKWDLERDRREGNLCKAFGPPGVIRQPTRVRIGWEDDDTLLLEFDAGRQQRRLRFAPGEAGAPSLQGHSTAQWYRQPQSRGVFGIRTPPEGGSLHVRTTNMTGGYLRPNGVPYGSGATMKEYFNTFELPEGGGTWLVVTTVLDDPEYLTTELLMSTQFKKEDGRGGFSPRDCDIVAPLVAAPAQQID
jgi:hypothetical protein